jgi:hypothetical protein
MPGLCSFNIISSRSHFILDHPRRETQMDNRKHHSDISMRDKFPGLLSHRHSIHNIDPRFKKTLSPRSYAMTRCSTQSWATQSQRYLPFAYKCLLSAGPDILCAPMQWGHTRSHWRSLALAGADLLFRHPADRRWTWA